MKNLKQLVTRNYYPLMYLLIAGSFLGLTAELVLTEHWDGIQLVGLLASIIGLVLAVVALFAAPRMRQALAVLFVVLSISGIIGTIEHNEARSGEEASAPVIVAATAGSSRELPAAQQQEGEENEAREGRGERGEREGEAAPPLAPMSLAGMSIIAAVTLIADDRNRQKAG
ncbi:MAG: hypothetical protein H6642_11160 [Caldilineaceae bacterium]|nr:hypothetical protein [Caldilineaceae bacterium]MCB9138894.1 hypothetical protein [Caldilineaceae bacterium]